MVIHMKYSFCTYLFLIMAFVGPMTTAAQIPPESQDFPAITWCQNSPKTKPAGSDYFVWIQEEAAKHNAKAEFCLSFLPKDLTTTPPEVWLIRAAEHGLPEAQLLYAAGLEVGKWGESDIQKALHWYAEAGKNGFGLAQIELAGIFFEGRMGLAPNLEAAKYWIDQPGAKGHPASAQLRSAIQQQWVRVHPSSTH